jgi:arylsulfatase A-like enzyme
MMNGIKLFPLLAILFAGSVAAKSGMNVVFFLVDDLGYYDLSLTGSKVFETPQIDRLGAEGMLFTQAYAAYPRCVPSRFAMMTGVHPSRAEGRGEILGNLDPARQTMAEAIKAHGYRTFFAGKWHLGKSEERYPEAQGFDINQGGGSAGAPGSYFPPYVNQKSLTGPEKLEFEPGQYLTDLLTDRAVEFIEENRNQPFFVYLSHYAVHTPIEGRPEKTRRYESKIKGLEFEGPEYVYGEDGRELRHQNNASYAAMVESVDESLGRLMETLLRLRLYDKTIIIFTSDHGGLSNTGLENKRELATSNLPLRAGKGHMYEGGIRVPVIVRWPGVIKGGSTASFPLTGMDYYPTILEMLDLPAREEAHVDGVSFVPGMKGRSDFNASRSFFWYSDRGRISSTGDRNAAVIRRGPYKLIEFFNKGQLELYNLSKDPGELEDLAEKVPDIRDRLYRELRAWKKEMKVRDRTQDE